MTKADRMGLFLRCRRVPNDAWRLRRLVAIHDELQAFIEAEFGIRSTILGSAS